MGSFRRIGTSAVICSLAMFAAGTASAQAPESDAVADESALPAAAGAEASAPADPAADESVAADQQKGGEDAARAPGGSFGPRDSKIGLRLKGLRGGKLGVGDKFTVFGKLRPFAKGERVTMLLKRGKKTIRRKTMFASRKPGKNWGKFKLSDRLVRSGRYSVQAIHKPSANLSGSKDRTRKFRIRYPDLDPGNKNNDVKLFNRLLERQGYVNDEGKRYDSATERAVLAFRKVNKMARTTQATSGIFKKLANGKGGYKLKYPNSGKHVEVDISRQVMVLAKGSKVKEIYHVSTGAPSTPTYPGTWRFYRKEPGTNSLGMQWSVYYHRGYATHGYKSVPTYPASHGCTRNPPPDSRHIYNWIDIGDLIHVYR